MKSKKMLKKQNWQHPADANSDVILSVSLRILGYLIFNKIEKFDKSFTSLN